MAVTILVQERPNKSDAFATRLAAMETNEPYLQDFNVSFSAEQADAIWKGKRPLLEPPGLTFALVSYGCFLGQSPLNSLSRALQRNQCIK